MWVCSSSARYASNSSPIRKLGTAALRGRIELYGDHEMSAAMPSRQAILELTLSDGRELRHHVPAVLGTAEDRMTRQQVDEKCSHLLAPVLGEQRSRELCDAVWSIEEIGSMDELRPLLTA